MMQETEGLSEMDRFGEEGEERLFGRLSRKEVRLGGRRRWG